jgi:hypothetical protein
MGETKNVYGIFLGKSLGKCPLEKLRKYRRITFRWIIEKL